MSSRFSNIKYYINSNKRLFASITLFGIGVSIAYYIYGPNSASENITKANKTEKVCNIIVILYIIILYITRY